jgi:hypothetical protein
VHLIREYCCMRKHHAIFLHLKRSDRRRIHSFKLQTMASDGCCITGGVERVELFRGTPAKLNRFLVRGTRPPILRTRFGYHGRGRFTNRSLSLASCQDLRRSGDWTRSAYCPFMDRFREVRKLITQFRQNTPLLPGD